MKLIAYQKGDRRIIARVLENKALPFANLDEFWADPQQSLVAAAQARSGVEAIADLVQVPPLPDSARVLCAGLNSLAHAQEAHFKAPEQPDIFARWRSTLAVDGQSIPIPPKAVSSDMPVSTAAAPANFKGAASGGLSARTPTAQDRLACGSLRRTK